MSAPTVTETRLRARVDRFTYPGAEHPALAGVDLTVGTGELVLLAGPSGSGKSTLALALAGLIPHRVPGALVGDVTNAAAGGVAIELTELALHEAAQHVGITFQNPEYQLIQYQVAAEVAFGPENLGLPHAEVVDRVHRALAAVGAEHLAEEAISSLSGGQKQRVAIAAALAMAPPLLILDEPTSDLDPVGTDEVLAVLDTLSHRHGHGVVVIEHKLDEIAPYADRVILVDGGRIVCDEPPGRAFLPTARWHAAGVHPPELVTLAEALAPGRPGLVDGGAPLTVDAAAERLGVPPIAGSRTVGSVASVPALGTSAARRPSRDVETVAAAGGPPPALEARSISVAFKGVPALADVSLRVQPGEWVALIGANGSGKTTLGATLMGFITPDAGEASCFGTPVRFGRIPAQADRLGYLFQNVDDMLFGASVEAELTFTARHRVAAGLDAPTPEEVAQLIGLTDRLDAHPHHLSGGERQRLALGALLTRAPRGLILDEPTTGLDERHATALFDLLARVRTGLGSLTCLLITHDMRLVARFADRVVVMSAGKIVGGGTPREVFAHPEALERWGVRPPPAAALHHRLAPAATRVAVDPAELAELICDHTTQEGLHVGVR